MSGYLVSFTVYTMAMCGLIFFALFVYKKFASGSLYSKSSKFLNVEDTLNIAPRKTLYVVRAGNERFLVAGDIDKTTLISKLGGSTEQNTNIQEFETHRNIAAPNNYSQQADNMNVKSIDDLPVIVDFNREQNSQIRPNNKTTDSTKNVIMDMVKRIKQ